MPHFVKTSTLLVKYEFMFWFLVLLRLNVPVNNCSVMSGRGHRFLGITSTFRGINVSMLKDTALRR